MKRQRGSWSRHSVAPLLPVAIPHYRIEAVERGPVSVYDLECAVRYFRLLGIEAWIGRWARESRTGAAAGLA